MTGTDDDWARQRREAADVHAQRLAQRRAQEHAAARALIEQFLVAARDRRLPTEAFVVQGPGGRGRARTGVHGWYLRQDRTMGLGTDGTVYRLTAPLSLRERLTGAAPVALDPPLVLGAGGKDGESVELRVALDRLLPGWDA